MIDWSTTVGHLIYPVPEVYKIHTSLHVLRLDLVHPIISGNKLFKLRKYVEKAHKEKYSTLLSFGGAYSNHIHALAAAAKSSSLKSIGIIRGERPQTLSPTLIQAQNEGMKLYFSSRDDFAKGLIPPEVFIEHKGEEILSIPEGGYGREGAEGIAEMLQEINPDSYTHLLTAAGTGTTAAGLLLGSSRAKVIAVPVLKNLHDLEHRIFSLAPEASRERLRILSSFHFGGYAKYTSELISFMNSWYQKTGIPTDFVYTAKSLFALNDLLEKETSGEARVLFIHTGGLQGNNSLKKGTLIFPSL